MTEELETEELTERRELCRERIASIATEHTVPEEYTEYFRAQAEKVMTLFDYAEQVASGKFEKLSAEEMKKQFDLLYREILPENYATSFSNPAYAVKCFGKRYGRLLTYLAAKLNQLVFYAAESNWTAMVLYAELFIEIYNYFEEYHEFTFRECREAIYWFEMDNMERFAEWELRAKFDPKVTFAREIIEAADKDDLRYLYRYGEYITENELLVARYLGKLSKKKITEMAANVVEGFLRGFTVMNVPRRKGQNVQLRYAIGFERMMKEVIALLEKEGHTVSASRTEPNLRHDRKRGYTVTNLNLQYDYDHRNDLGLLADKQWFTHRKEVMERIMEEQKETLSLFCGPLVQETFGEKMGLPKNVAEAVQLDKRQQRMKLEFTSELSMITEKYLPSEQISFTIVAYPLPSIGADFEKIFEDTLRLNQLDNAKYQEIQQKLIDALDRAERVHVTGRGNNHTDLTVELWKLKNPDKETIFENCTADVNIPVGEVFTSPVLTGTNGILHVTSVFLGSTEYKNLEITFRDGKTMEYSCTNYASPAENKSFIRENLLKNHDWLPLGEFAIGTNTVAYTMGRKYGITEVLPILIAEKTGPHFAIGDTCYSHSEEHKVYNPNGKEIVARENECSALRNQNPEQAYFQCHTDITIPYSELGDITAICKDGTEILLIHEGRFVLPGTEILNEALEE